MRSFFKRSMLLILRKMQYFRGVDTVYTENYAVFFWGRYCLYQAMGSIFGGSMQLISSNGQYFRGVDDAYIKQWAVFSGGR